MKVKVCYSKYELEATVDYISENNKYFLGKKDIIRTSILDSIKKITKNFSKGHMYMGTMGYIVIGDILEEESMSGDENIIYINFLVEPGLFHQQQIISDEDLAADLAEEMHSV